MGYCFVPEYNHAQESHACQFCHFFPAIFGGLWFVEIEKFCCQGNVMCICNDFSSLLKSFRTIDNKLCLS